MKVFKKNSYAALLYVLGTSGSSGMEPAEGEKTYESYDKNLWQIHGSSIARDSAALQRGLASLQLPTQMLFEQKVAESDRQVLYSVYALSKRIPREHAIGMQKFEEIMSLARSFYALEHTFDIRPYVAANIFGATSKQIAEYCAHKTDVDEAAIDSLIKHPQFMYQHAPYTTPSVEKAQVARCGKNPIVINAALWSINPDDEHELWCETLMQVPAAIKKLTKPLVALCASEGDLFAATHSGAILRPYRSNTALVCDEVVVCHHPITHIAATESGASIIAADAEHVSIIVRSNGSYITHTIDYSPLQLVGIRDVGKSYQAIAVTAPQIKTKKSLTTYWDIQEQNAPKLINKELVVAQEAPQEYALGKNNVLYCALKTKSGEWCLASIRTDLIPELAPPENGSRHTPSSVVQKIVHTHINPSGTLSIGYAQREKIGKSWIIWDHTTDEIHELPDNMYDAVVPEDVASNGDISVLAGNNKTGYSRITIHARPHLTFVQDPKSSFKCKLLLLAAVGAHCMDGLLSIEDDQHWKEPFNELPKNLQDTLTALYPVYTKSLLGGSGKSIIKTKGVSGT